MRHQTFLLYTLVLLTLAGCGEAHPSHDADDESPIIPTLPEVQPIGGLPEGHSWKFADGPDFYTFHSIGDEAGGQVGFYVGFHPGFREKQNATVRKARFGPLAAEWSISPVENNGVTFHHAQSLMSYRHSPGHVPAFIHAWASAPTRPALETLLTDLADLKLEDVTGRRASE